MASSETYRHKVGAAEFSTDKNISCKMIFLLKMLILTFFIDVEATLSIKGTTTSPAYKRVVGVETLKCPQSHPVAFNDGNNCCGHENNTLDETLAIKFEDSVGVCRADDLMACPNLNRLCTDFVLKEEPCPMSHPYPIESGTFCCGSSRYRAKDSGSCDGTSLLFSDPRECCVNADFIPCSRTLCYLPYTETLMIRQDIRQNPNFFNDSNYLYHNAHDLNAEMFSRMGDMDDFRTPADGLFHLKLCYPTLIDTDSSEPCYEFKQDKNPLLVRGATEDLAFEVLQKPYDVEEDEHRFNGLRSDRRGITYLNADFSSYWHWIAILTQQNRQGILSHKGKRVKLAEMFAITP